MAVVQPGGSALNFLPNIIWQAQHDFISLDFLQHIHSRDVAQGRARGFLPGQFKLTLLAFPLWIAGLRYYLYSHEGKRYRMLGWMYIVPLLLFLMAKGREYYFAGTYPMLYAAGAVSTERWLASLRSASSQRWRWAIWAALTVDAIIAAAIMLPIAPVNSPWFNIANRINGDMREEIGWPEFSELRNFPVQRFASSITGPRRPDPWSAN